MIRAPVLEVVQVAGLSTIQDGGRPGRMHEGIPPGGALVPELLARANRAVGNAHDAPAIEVIGAITLAARDGAFEVATEDFEVRAVAEGGTWRVEKRRDLRVRYVAVRGGIAVARVLGGRGTLVVAGVGGYGGRGLRKGDRVGVGVEGEGGGEGGGDRWEDGGGGGGAIRVVVGPDDDLLAPDALRALLGEPFRVSPASDRTGSRLSGPPLRRRGDVGARPAPAEPLLPSTPMVAGAIEVPPSGDPIVLGPDHPTTGGYPVLAVIVRADLGRFHALPLGAHVRFTRADMLPATRV